MRQRIFTFIARMTYRHSGIIVLVALIATALAAGVATRLQLTTRFSDLMPQGNPMVVEFNKIVEEYSTASNIIIVVQGEPDQMKPFADRLAASVEQLEEYVERVTHKIDEGYIARHGFMLEETSDLENIQDLFSDLGLIPLLAHINDSFEKEYVEDELSLSTKEKEDEAIRYLEGLERWIKAIDQYALRGPATDPAVARDAVYTLLVGDPYYLSYDKTMLLLIVRPTFPITDLDMCVAACDTIEALIDDLAAAHPGIDAGLTGTIVLARDELVAARSDMYLTSILALVLILALFIFSFRMWTAPLLAALNLIIGITWAAALAAVTVRTLNIMTSMFAAILLGLGVDFSIHIISLYTERRAMGESVPDALRDTLNKSGSGIVTGALTTACAFFTLMIADSAGIREMGFVMGEGVILCMLSAVLVLPSMLTLRERIAARIARHRVRFRARQFTFIGALADGAARYSTPTLIAVLLLTALFLYSALHVQFDYNYLNMEPEGLTSVILQERMIEKFDISPDFALITTSTVEDARTIAEAAKELGIVGGVESISEYLPSQEQQQRRRPYLWKIRRDLTANRTVSPITPGTLGRLIEELGRLEDNVVELSQLAFISGRDKVDRTCQRILGEPGESQGPGPIALAIDHISEDRTKATRHLNHFQSQYEPILRQRAMAMASPDPITIDSVPTDIVERYVSRSGDRFLVTIYPKEQVWNIKFLNRFTEQMKRIDPRVTGTPPLFLELIQVIGRDGRRATGVALIVIFLLLFLDFHSIRSTLLAMIPLLIGAVWMVGIMHLIGMKLTIVNVMGIPLILGIGIDDGVHILHRHRVEARGNIRAILSSTGKAVLITSLTTMLAFGSLVFATYRGLGSLGSLLFIGVGTCLITSLVALPALLGLVDRFSRRVDSTRSTPRDHAAPDAA